jgi:hypothetical protein
MSHMGHVIPYANQLDHYWRRISLEISDLDHSSTLTRPQFRLGIRYPVVDMTLSTKTATGVALLLAVSGMSILNLFKDPLFWASCPPRPHLELPS